MRLQAARLGCELQCGPYAWDLKKGSRVIRIGRRHRDSVLQLAADLDHLFDTLAGKALGSQEVLDFSHIQLHEHRASGAKFELLKWPETENRIDTYLEEYQPYADDLVFDLGAGCGISTYAFSEMAKHVIAFEPDSQLRVILERNIQRLELKNVTVAKSVASFADLMQLHHEPSFCKVDLDQVSPSFFDDRVDNGYAWKGLRTIFAAASRSKRVRGQFTALLRRQGFEIAASEAKGMLWARPTGNGPG